MALVVSGRIVPLDRADPDEVFTGRVFVDDSGSIERVTAGTATAPSGFANAPVVDVGDAFVLPGLIDLHITSATTRCRRGRSPSRRPHSPIPIVGPVPQAISPRLVGQPIPWYRLNPKRR